MQTTEVKPAVVVESYPEMPEAAQVLSKARNYLSEPSHWLKGTWEDGHGGYCAYGVIAHFCEGLRFTPTSRWIERALGGTGDIIAYNNSVVTTHADILALFDRAIALALEPTHAD